MTAIVMDVLGAMPAAALVLVAVVFVVRLVEQLRRHRPVANKRFMARYRAEHPTDSRTTGDAPTPCAFPLVRRRTPAGADRVPPNRPRLPGPEGHR